MQPLRQVAIVGNLALVLMLAVTALCLVAVTGSARVISYTAFALSIGLLIGYRAPAKVWEQGLEDNLYLVVLFSVVPLLRIPIRYGGYFEALRTVFERFVHSRGRFYLFVSLVSAFFGSIVNLAIVRSSTRSGGPACSAVTKLLERRHDSWLHDRDDLGADHARQ